MAVWTKVLLGAFSVVLVVCGVMGQKRSAVADLEMLVSDPSTYANSETYGRSGGYDTDNFVGLADTLRRLQELQKFYSHQGRSR
jgi:hypothetical protein